MQDFKKLKVWQKSHQFTLDIYKTTKNYPKEETSQLRRSSVSVPANVAEGCGKLRDNDTRNFFQTSLGSAHEVEYYLILSKDLNYISEESYNSLNKEINEIKAMLISLIKINIDRVNN